MDKKQKHWKKNFTPKIFKNQRSEILDAGEITVVPKDMFTFPSFPSSQNCSLNS